VSRAYDVAQCWSFSKAGARCEGEAGHDGDHMVETTWTDAEAWTPQFQGWAGVPGQTPEVPIYGMPSLPADPEPVAPPQGVYDAVDDGEPLAGCFNCGHREHVGPCEVSVGNPKFGKTECGCNFTA
jgi:hypothetical protein